MREFEDDSWNLKLAAEFETALDEISYEVTFPQSLKLLYKMTPTQMADRICELEAMLQNLEMSHEMELGHYIDKIQDLENKLTKNAK